MQRFLILLYFILALANPAMSQTAGNSHLRQYTTDNGLPSNGIKGLQWDEKTGFLWIASEAGIVRFNGVDFRSYTKENMPSITTERMLFMVRNRKEHIYISDMAGNIFWINQNKPVLSKKGAENVNPYYANVGLSDTACLLLNNGTLFYHSITMPAPVALPFERGSFKSFFKINDQYFLINNKKEALLLNTSDFTVSPVAVTDINGSRLLFETGN